MCFSPFGSTHTPRVGFPCGLAGKDSTCNGFDRWVGKIPWRRKSLPTPVFWPRECYGLYSPWSCKELDTTERLSLSHPQSNPSKALGYPLSLPSIHHHPDQPMLPGTLTSPPSHWRGWSRGMSRSEQGLWVWICLHSRCQHFLICGLEIIIIPTYVDVLRIKWVNKYKALKEVRGM